MMIRYFGLMKKSMLVMIQNYMEQEYLDWVQRIKDVVGINKMEVLVVWKPTLDGC
jgi:hypothetical protein